MGVAFVKKGIQALDVNIRNVIKSVYMEDAL